MATTWHHRVQRWDTCLVVFASSAFIVNGLAQAMAVYSSDVRPTVNGHVFVDPAEPLFGAGIGTGILLASIVTRCRLSPAALTGSLAAFALAGIGYSLGGILLGLATQQATYGVALTAAITYLLAFPIGISYLLTTVPNQMPHPEGKQLGNP